MSSLRYAVIGVGYVGQRVLRQLPAGSATGFSRSPIDDPGVESRILDLDVEPGTPVRLPDVDALLYTVPPPPTGTDDPRFERLLSCLGKAQARVVYLSTTGVYGDRQGAAVSESDAPRPETARARRRLAAETRLRKWAADHGVDYVILRVPGIYGPGRLGLDRIEAGAEVLIEAEAGPGNRIHVDDLVACCLAAMKADTPSGIYNVGDGDHRSTGAFTRNVARIAGLREPLDISLKDAKERWSAMRLSFILESRRVDTAKMRDVLGVEPRYANPEDGIRASLADNPD